MNADITLTNQDQQICQHSWKIFWEHKHWFINSYCLVVGCKKCGTLKSITQDKKSFSEREAKDGK